MLTDDEALTLLTRVRRSTTHLDVVELCDWVFRRVWAPSTNGEAEIGNVAREPPSVSAPSKGASDRKEYMRDYMRTRRSKAKP